MTIDPATGAPSLFTTTPGTLNRDSAEPLFEQLANLLWQAICDGRYMPKLPSEPMLAAEWGVSRPTVRKAIAVLVGENRVRVSLGKGTYPVPVHQRRHG